MRPRRTAFFRVRNDSKRSFEPPPIESRHTSGGNEGGWKGGFLAYAACFNRNATVLVSLNRTRSIGNGRIFASLAGFFHSAWLNLFCGVAPLTNRLTNRGTNRGRESGDSVANRGGC